MILMEALYIAGKIMGVRAMVARYVGAGDIRCASKIAGQAIVLGALWGIIFTKFQSLCKNFPLLVEYPTLNNQA
jgi:Na+-driven multidrug efflux pump